VARKSIGYTKLQWTCPNCKTINPGPEKLCISCGSPQPENIRFESAQSSELLKDQNDIDQAKAGPDIHCAFCGARNASNQQICSRCGAELIEGKKRVKGRVVGAYSERQKSDIECSTCGNINPAEASFCITCGSPLGKSEIIEQHQESTTKTEKPVTDKKKKSGFGIVLGIGFLIIICGFMIWFLISLLQTEEISGTVQNVSWTRSVNIEEFTLVQKEDWLSEIPSDAELGVCELAYHHTQDNPAPNAEEICGTPYSIDQGSGYAEVVQDCEYKVYEDYCEYEIEEWIVVDQLTSTGYDYTPEWPVTKLSTSQRIGQQEESYTIIFDTDEGELEYQTDDFLDLQLYQPGSQWNLEVNKFNAITSLD